LGLYTFKQSLLVFTFIFCLTSALSAQELSEKIDKAIEEEFKWLQAEAMVVTVATKTRVNMDDAPSIVSVITEDQIKNSGAKTFMEILRHAAGVNVYHELTYPDGVICIRGLGDTSNPNIKIMLNGHSTEFPAFSNGDILFSFPVNLIKKIEIIRGPGSALYGSSAMNGVINIISKDAEDPSEISAEYGSFGTYGTSGQLSYSKNDFKVFLFADSLKSDGDPQLIEKDAATAMFPPGYSLAPGYSNEDFELYNFFTKFAYRDFYLTGFYSGGHCESPVGILSILSDENDNRNERSFVEAGYEGSLTDKIRFNAKAYYDYMKFDAVYEGFSQNTTPLFGMPPGEGGYANSALKSCKTGTEMMFTIRTADSLELITGVSYEYSEDYAVKYFLNLNVIGRPMEINGVNYMPMQYLGGMSDISIRYPWMENDLSRTVYAGYVQGTWNMTEAFPSLKRIGKNLSLTAGLRYDNYDDVGDTLNPRLGLVYAPNEKLFFKLLYGKAFHAPLFNQMYIRNNPAQIGNPLMESETITTAEFLAGIHLNEHNTATLDFFTVRKEDTIRLYQGVWSNWGQLESRGIESEIRLSFDRHKYGYFNVTFQKANDVTHEVISDIGGTAYTQEDYNIGMYPELTANLGVNYDIGKNININATLNYIASIKRIGRMQFTPSPDDPDGTVEPADKREPIDSYTLFNLSLIFHHFDFARGWELQLTGYNLFNAEQRDPDRDGSVPNDLPRWDRHFLGKLSYTF